MSPSSAGPSSSSTFPTPKAGEHRLMHVDRREYLWPEIGHPTSLTSVYVAPHTITERRWVCSCGQRGRWAEESSVFAQSKHKQHARGSQASSGDVA